MKGLSFSIRQGKGLYSVVQKHNQYRHPSSLPVIGHITSHAPFILYFSLFLFFPHSFSLFYSLSDGGNTGTYIFYHTGIYLDPQAKRDKGKVNWVEVPRTRWEWQGH
jgi:hypothetical protein